MKLIAIETATEICSIAYIDNGKCIDIVEDKIPRQHAEKLPLFYDELVKLTGFTLSEIDAIAVSIGPGSFTGLRIGLSYTKGLAYSHKKPIIPVPTMQSLLHGSGKTNGKIAVMLLSHGNKYFIQQFEGSGGSPDKSGYTLCSDSSSHASRFKYSNIHVLTCERVNDLGIDLSKTKIIHWNCDKLFDNIDKNRQIIKVKPSARLIGALAHQNYDKWVVKKPYKLVPDYVSPFKIGSLKSEI